MHKLIAGIASNLNHFGKRSLSNLAVRCKANLTDWIWHDIRNSRDERSRVKVNNVGRHIGAGLNIIHLVDKLSVANCRAIAIGTRTIRGQGIPKVGIAVESNWDVIGHPKARGDIVWKILIVINVKSVISIVHLNWSKVSSHPILHRKKIKGNRSTRTDQIRCIAYTKYQIQFLICHWTKRYIIHTQKLLVNLILKTLHVRYR